MADAERDAIKKVDEKLGRWSDDPEDYTHDGQPRCTAHSKQSGERCRRSRKPGTTVCATHGGNNPSVRRAARLRLLDLIDPAVAKLARVLATTPDDRVALKAVEMILDRAGMPAKQSIDVEDSRTLLVERLRDLQERKAQEEIEGAEVIDDEIADVQDQLDDPTHASTEEQH